MARDLETQTARLFSVGFHGTALNDDLSHLVARGVGRRDLFLAQRR